MKLNIDSDIETEQGREHDACKHINHPKFRFGLGLVEHTEMTGVGIGCIHGQRLFAHGEITHGVR